MIKRENGRTQILCLMMIAVTLCFIWGNSMLPASSSRVVSGYAREILNAVLRRVGSQRVLSVNAVRKLAHACEYAVLGLEMSILVRVVLKKQWQTIMLSGIFIALLDETFQLFANGRGGMIRDVWIDLGGFCGGMLVVFLYQCIRKATVKGAAAN